MQTPGYEKTKSYELILCVVGSFFISDISNEKIIGKRVDKVREKERKMKREVIAIDDTQRRRRNE